MRVSITEQLQTYFIEILIQYRVHVEQGTLIYKICFVVLFDTFFTFFFGFYTKI